jgi:hypothetical protein
MAIISNLFSQDGEGNLPILTYHHGLKLDKIQEPGNEFVFKQFCMPLNMVDSVISSGNIKFKGSKIGKITDCVLEWQIRDDTLRKIIIETSKEKQTNQAIAQATDQFGDPTEVKSNNTSSYRWDVQTQKNKFTVQLIVSEDQTTGTMTITM